MSVIQVLVRLSTEEIHQITHVLTADQVCYLLEGKQDGTQSLISESGNSFLCKVFSDFNYVNYDSWPSNFLLERAGQEVGPDLWMSPLVYYDVNQVKEIDSFLKGFDFEKIVLGSMKKKIIERFLGDVRDEVIELVLKEEFEHFNKVRELVSVTAKERDLLGMYAS